MLWKDFPILSTDVYYVYMKVFPELYATESKDWLKRQCVLFFAYLRGSHESPFCGRSKIWTKWLILWKPKITILSSFWEIGCIPSIRCHCNSERKSCRGCWDSDSYHYAPQHHILSSSNEWDVISHPHLLIRGSYRCDPQQHILSSNNENQTGQTPSWTTLPLAFKQCKSDTTVGIQILRGYLNNSAINIIFLRQSFDVTIKALLALSTPFELSALSGGSFFASIPRPLLFLLPNQVDIVEKKLISSMTDPLQLKTEPCQQKTDLCCLMAD
ncbi:hypothetical protein LguiB_032183 [Lonicera macranthoides]